MWQDDLEARRQGFSLRTAVGLALLLHLLLFVGLDRYRVLVLPLPTEAPREEPLRFVFAETPPSPEPPPPTRQLAAEQHRAAAPEPQADAPRQVTGQDVVARLAQPQSPPQPQPRQPRPTPVPQPARTPPPTQPPAQAPVHELSDSGRYVRKSPDQEPPTPTFSSTAITQAVVQALPGSVPTASNVPRGVMDFDAKDFDWGAYAQRIYKIIEKNWHSELRARAMPGIAGVSRLRFRIDRAGRISALELLEGSKWKMLDIAALGSIQLSNPLPQLPADYPNPDVGLTFSYYFNVPPGGAE